jgi:hypothetical protein
MGCVKQFATPDLPSDHADQVSAHRFLDLRAYHTLLSRSLTGNQESSLPR